MNAIGAYVEGDAGQRSVGKVARQIIEDRFVAVRKVLPSAAELTGDPEPIHQLRVATRRANAAITVFAPRLPERVGRRARKFLRRLRRSAATRDADVFLAGLESWSPGRPNVEKPGIQFLNGHVLAERRLGQVGIVEAVDWAEKHWRSRMNSVSNSVHRGGPTLAEFAKPVLSSMIRALDCAVDGADFDDAARLHALRVAGKRVRYSLEVLLPSAAEGDETPPLIAALADMQRILGRANDNVQAIRRLDRLFDDLMVVRPRFLANIRGGITAFRAKHREEFAEERAAFVAWKAKRVPFRHSEPET